MIELVVGAVLVFVAIEDMRRFRIRNGLVVVLVLAFVLACAWHGRLHLVLPHLLFALAGLALLYAAFTMGAIGGGDAKLLTAALLWIGPEGALVYSIALAACALAYVLAARLGLAPSRRAGRRTEIPFGPSIALAWIAFLAFTAHLETGRRGEAQAAHGMARLARAAAD